MVKKTKPVQRDIARIAEVSQAVVSMVVNGRAAENGIPETTQERIRAAIRQLGYVPNVAARSLRGGRNGLIGVHTFERVFPVHSDNYFNEILIGIEEQAVELGQDLVLFASTQGSDGTRTIYGSGSNRLKLADGAVILGLEQNDEELRRLAGEGFPFVFIGHRDVPGVPYVTAGYFGAVGAVVNTLADHGHSSIAYLGTSLTKNPQEERRAGFDEAIAFRALNATQRRICEPNQLTQAWLLGVLDAGTTAIVIENHELATTLGGLAAAIGIGIPDQLSVVVLDNAPRADAVNPWSHITVPRRELGRRAVAVLIELLDGHIGSDHFEVLPCEPPLLTTIARLHSTSELGSTSDRAT
ncbi:MAG: LacI family DNA-binding transcriptional regulator [Propionibacteriaceae bacterium]